MLHSRGTAFARRYKGALRVDGTVTRVAVKAIPQVNKSDNVGWGLPAGLVRVAAAAAALVYA